MFSKKNILTFSKTVLPLFLGVYLIWFFFSSMSKESLDLFYKAIKEANYFWIVISMLLGVVAYLSRAYRWDYVLKPLGYETKFWNRYHAIMIGYLVNLTIPRAGEASRSAMLYRSDGVPFSSSFGTIIAERAVDFAMLVGIGFLTAFLGMDDFWEIKSRIETEFGRSTAEGGSSIFKYIIYAVILILFLGAGYFILFKKEFRKKLMAFALDVWKGLFSIFRSKNPLGYVIQTLIIWGCYIVMFALPFQALAETQEIHFGGILLGFCAGALGIAFTNGGVGTYPLLVGLVVAFYLGDENKSDAQAIGNALGMIIWISQTLLLILLGLLSLVLLPKNFSKENKDEQTELR